MNVFVLSTGSDTGGQGARIAKAFRRHAPGWNVRAMHPSANYLGYPADLPWDKDEAQRLYDAADVVHHQNQLHGYQMFERGHTPAVMHHHGSRLRNNAVEVRREARSIGAVSMVSTVDLLQCAPAGAAWLPSPFELDELAAYRRPRRKGPLVIAHAPTNREIKSTDVVIAAVERLQASYDVELDLIEGVPWKVCLDRKGRADILVDQLVLGYGNNAIEAMAMSIPVVCGIADPQVRSRAQATWGADPFYAAAVDDLQWRLEELIRSTELREEYGARGRAHVERFHAAADVVEQLKAVYAAAPPSRGVGRLRLADLGRKAPRVMA
ncbi:MAG: glycosyltransferase [Burkholderiaceae bacterium]